MEAIQNFRLGWRRSKAGKKFHFYDQEGKPLCGRSMKNVFLAEDAPVACICKKCLKIRGTQ
jgi:hypothetical protein